MEVNEQTAATIRIFRVSGPVTFISDVHNMILNVDKLKRAPNLFCLGDIVDMFDRQQNRNTLGYWKTLQIPTLRGNHDRTVSQSSLLPLEDKELLASLPFSFRIESDFGNILLYHATAESDDKVVPAKLTEKNARRFFRPTPDIQYVFHGHTHKQRRTLYPSGLTVVNVGTLLYGHYATLDDKGVCFCKVR